MQFFYDCVSAMSGAVARAAVWLWSNKYSIALGVLIVAFYEMGFWPVVWSMVVGAVDVGTCLAKHPDGAERAACFMLDFRRCQEVPACPDIPACPPPAKCAPCERCDQQVKLAEHRFNRSCDEIKFNLQRLKREADDKFATVRELYVKAERKFDEDMKAYEKEAEDIKLYLTISLAINALYTALFLVLLGWAVAKWINRPILGEPVHASEEAGIWDDSVEYVPEKVIPGNPFREPAPAPCQVSIYSCEPPMLIGQGFRVKDQIVTAFHVLDRIGEKFRLVGQGLLDGKPRSVTVGMSRVSQIEDKDIATIDISPAEMLVLGVSSANLVDVFPSSMVFVSGAKDSSIGELTSVMSPFGRVEYAGSTKSGFSGAPYFVGKKVYGMHLASSSKLNQGCAAGYIKLLLRGQEKTKDESTEEWLVDVIKRGKKRAYESTPDPDEYRVAVDMGRLGVMYHVISSDLYMKYQNESVSIPEDDKVSRLEKKLEALINAMASKPVGRNVREIPIVPTAEYHNVPNDSGNAMLPRQAVAAGEIGLRKEAEDAQSRNSISLQEILSQYRRKGIEVTGVPRSTLAPLSAVLLPTVGSPEWVSEFGLQKTKGGRHYVMPLETIVRGLEKLKESPPESIST